MKITSITAAYFSPAETTKQVIDEVIAGIGCNTLKVKDITSPEARRHPLQAGKDELLVIGIPVYMGRVPALLGEWFSVINANGTPTVFIVVYGNRDYEDALLELRDILAGNGMIPIAGAAFIGEHSFSNANTPSLGRPDINDKNQAKKFGRNILKKFESTKSPADFQELDIPGNTPYGGITELWDIDFIEVGEKCTNCGYCAEICPMGAISHTDSSNIDIHKCITCCACIKKCPQEARTMKPGPVKEAQNRINTLFRDRKEPECYL